MKNKEEIINKFIERNISKLDDFVPTVNNNKPFFQDKDFEITEGIPKYFELDELNRASGGIAIISKYTLSIQEYNRSQKFRYRICTIQILYLTHKRKNIT